MQGTKRFGVSDPDTNDSAFRNKRIMPGSAFNVHRAEPSQLQPAATVSLDVQRAESSQHHVRALNAQFASWVQKQLKTHPDELWEDGVRDYLAHASSIMEKFSDIVMWLKANASRGENPSAIGPFTAEKKMVTEIKNNETILFHGNTGFAPVGNSTSFATPWSTGAFSTSQTPVLFGIQNSIPITRDISEDADGENEAEQPSSPSVKKSEEKGVLVVHEVKCKLFVKTIGSPSLVSEHRYLGNGREEADSGFHQSEPCTFAKYEADDGGDHGEDQLTSRSLEGSTSEAEEHQKSEARRRRGKRLFGRTVEMSRGAGPIGHSTTQPSDPGSHSDSPGPSTSGEPSVVPGVRFICVRNSTHKISFW